MPFPDLAPGGALPVAPQPVAPFEAGLPLAPVLATLALAVPLLCPLVLGLYRRLVAPTLLRTRMREAVLAFLHGRPGATVGETAVALGVDYKTVQHHVRVLEHFGLVRGTRVGRRILYAPLGGEPGLRLK